MHKKIRHKVFWAAKHFQQKLLLLHILQFPLMLKIWDVPTHRKSSIHSNLIFLIVYWVPKIKFCI